MGSYECEDLGGVCEGLEARLVQMQPCCGSEG